ITIILVLLFVFVVIFLLSLVRNPKQETNTPTPTPAATLSTTPSASSLRILDILPSASQAYLPFQKITLIFNEPVSLDTELIQTTPHTEIQIIQVTQSSEVLIAQVTTWQIGATRLSILQETGLSGKQLANQVSYSIITPIPTLSEEEINDIPP